MQLDQDIVQELSALIDAFADEEQTAELDRQIRRGSYAGNQWGCQIALPLDGWDDASLWGYDTVGSHEYYFAQLYINGRPSVNDEPHIWITRDVQTLAQLVDRIANATGSDEAEVTDALADSLRSALARRVADSRSQR
jgi:hypothetical protein